MIKKWAEGERSNRVSHAPTLSLHHQLPTAVHSLDFHHLISIPNPCLCALLQGVQPETDGFSVTYHAKMGYCGRDEFTYIASTIDGSGIRFASAVAHDTTRLPCVTEHQPSSFVQATPAASYAPGLPYYFAPTSISISASITGR